MAVGLLLSFVLALVFAVLAGTPEAAERAVPIDPGNAAPDTVLAEAAGVEISTPIRPESLTGLGYHPEGESLVEMAPRGENLSANALIGLFADGSTPERTSTTTSWTQQAVQAPGPAPSTSEPRRGRRSTLL